MTDVPTKVAAAAGHPASCETATLGSVCHCECAGVRHSWGGVDVPSGVKAPTGATTEDATPAPAQDADAAALTGTDALNSTPLSLEREDAAPSGAQLEALGRYVQAGFIPINHLLRGGDVSTLGANALPEDTVRAWIDAMDAAMNDSRLPGDVVTWRGVTDGSRLFGDAYDGDLTGLEWREDAYTSTTTDEDMAREFTATADGTDPAPHPTMMHIATPAGTGAIEMSGDWFESELLLERGLRMRVVHDYGVGPDGVRRLDVEVVPDAG